MARSYKRQYDEWIRSAKREETRRRRLAEAIRRARARTAYEEEIHFFLERTGLEKTTFDIIVGVDTAECMKPHPDIFKYALGKLDVRPEEAMFVGDGVEADYKGAENVGMYALLINRTEKKKQSGMRTIKNLKEILSQID